MYLSSYINTNSPCTQELPMHTGYRLKGDVKNEKITLWDLPHCYHIILTRINLVINWLSRLDSNQRPTA